MNKYILAIVCLFPLYIFPQELEQEIEQLNSRLSQLHNEQSLIESQLESLTLKKSTKRPGSHWSSGINAWRRGDQTFRYEPGVR